MSLVHEKLQHVCDRLNLSRKDVAALCDLRYTTFNSMISKESSVPFAVLDKVSQAFGVPLDYFSDRVADLDAGWPKIRLVVDKGSSRRRDAAARAVETRIEAINFAHARQGRTVTIQTFLDWWVRNNGRLVEFEAIAQRVDLFDPPNGSSKVIKPVRIGMDSLATRLFKLKETNHLKATLDGFSDERNEKLVKAHLDALRTGEPVISHPSLDETLLDGSRFVKRYRRVMAPVTLPDGSEMLLNYSEEIG